MEKKQSYKYNFRLNNIENKKFADKLKMSGMSKSNFIRIALSKTVVVPRFNEEELQSLRALRSLSNNLNQIAKRVNQNQEFLTLVLELKKTKANIDSIINTIFKI